MKKALSIYHQERLNTKVVRRTGELKLGENIYCLKKGENLDILSAYGKENVRYVLLGIPESVGPMANHGLPGAENAWDAFLDAFLNLQSNRFLTGKQLLCLGHILTDDLQQQAGLHRQDYGLLKNLCAILDERVSSVIRKIISAGMCPIVIGGGHNNSYPLLKGTSQAKGAKVNCINCDAHTDLRPAEGRHSGNGFSYAQKEGFLHQYYIFGMHEGYTPETILKEISFNPLVAYTSFESIHDFDLALDKSLTFFDDTQLPFGIELDMDCIKLMPASALTPSGFTLEEARKFIRKTGAGVKPSYLHIAEAAPQNSSKEKAIVGKALAYLVADFIKSAKR